MRLFVCLSVCPFVRPSVCSSVRLYVCSSVRLSVCVPNFKDAAACDKRATYDTWRCFVSPVSLIVAHDTQFKNTLNQRGTFKQNPCFQVPRLVCVTLWLVSSKKVCITTHSRRVTPSSSGNGHQQSPSGPMSHIKVHNRWDIWSFFATGSDKLSRHSDDECLHLAKNNNAPAKVTFCLLSSSKLILSKLSLRTCIFLAKQFSINPNEDGHTFRLIPVRYYHLLWCVVTKQAAKSSNHHAFKDVCWTNRSQWSSA